MTIEAGATAVIRLRLAAADGQRPGVHDAIDTVLEKRRREADEFYATVIPPTLDADEALVMRQALAGMLWTKQFYHYDVGRWLEERGIDPFKRRRSATSATGSWHHMDNARRHLDAGQMGVPLVRGLGPRLPRPRADARRPGLRQGAAEADAARATTCTPTARSRPTSGTSATSTRRSTPGRPSSPTGWRRQHAARATATGSRACFQKLLLNFTWWVNRKDRRGQQRVRRRLPRPRQHRRVRPQRAAADRRLPGAGRRHGLDGAVLPEHARDRRRAGA